MFPLCGPFRSHWVNRGNQLWDIAALKGEDVDWANNTVSFFRKKTGVPVLVHLGSEALNLLKDLASSGPLFPYLSRVRAGDRATEFKQRCQQLKIAGVTGPSRPPPPTSRPRQYRLAPLEEPMDRTLRYRFATAR